MPSRSRRARTAATSRRRDECTIPRCWRCRPAIRDGLQATPTLDPNLSARACG
jgi:hypothetical protein